MAILAKNNGGGDFEQPEAGSYLARLYKIIDIGTQEQSFQGKPSNSARKAYFWWELLQDEDGNDYRQSDGEVFSVMKEYTLSTGPKANLRKHIDSWRGKPLTDEQAESFDVESLLGHTARLQLTVTEKDNKKYVNVASVGSTKKELEGTQDTFSWGLDEPDLKAFEELPGWLQKRIVVSEEWPQFAAMVSGKAKEHVDKKTGEVIIDDIDENDPLDPSELKF